MQWTEGVGNEDILKNMETKRTFIFRIRKDRRNEFNTRHIKSKGDIVKQRVT